MAEPPALDDEAPPGEGFVPFGAFDPFEAKRLLRHLENEGICFCVEARQCVKPAYGSGIYRRYSQIRIFVQPEDRLKAQSILREDQNG